MGGTAFCLPIESPEPQLLDRALHPKTSLLDRILGRRRPQVSRDDLVLDVPLPKFQRAIFLAFRRFLREALPQPWPATKSVFDYLAILRDRDVYVRRYRDREDGGDEWCVQLSFSGCGGMAEISALVAEHWAQFWYRRERERIEALIRSHGLVPSNEGDRSCDQNAFLPANQWGYAALYPEYAGIPLSELEEGLSCFDLDQACFENNPKLEKKLCRFLTERFERVVRERRCHCQFCDPNFDLSLLKEMPK